MNRTPEFPPMYLEYLKLARQAGALSPIWLGGTGGAGGGNGGPPGGWIGQLPQNMVTYDTTEAATTSGSSSLVDNLNHIRYMLANAQFNSGVAGVEFVQTEYSGGDIDLGSVADGAYVDADATNAALSITPNSAGTFRATFDFTYLCAFSSTTDAITMDFRLTDGTTNIDSQSVIFSSNTPITLSGLFTWANTSARTIKLQKKIVAISGAPAANRILCSSTSVLHMDVFRLGSIATGFISGAGAAGRVAYWTSGSVLSNDSTFTWDAVNSRLGIGKLSLTSGSMSLSGNVFALDASMKIDPTGAINGQVLGYNGSKWVPVTSSGSQAGTSGSGGTGQFTFWSGTNSLTGYSHIDYTSATSKVRFGASGDVVLVGINATPGNNTTLQVTQPDTAGGTDPSVLILTPGILTAQTGNPANFLSQSATITWVKANLPTSFYPNLFSAPSLNSTLPNGVIQAAATVKINGAPTSGSNLSILNAYSLEITSGSVYIGGPLSLAGKFFKLDATMEIDPSGATNGQVLAYSAGLGKWIAQVSSASGGGGASGISGAGASSRIAYFTSGSVIAGDANFSWDTTNQKIIIGGTPADVPVGSSASLVIIKESGLSGISLFEYGSSLASVFMSRANGTKASPSNLLAGDIVGGFNISGFGSTAWASSSRLKMQGVAAESWTDAAQGMYLAVNVTQPGTLTSVDAFDVKYDRVVVTGKDLILDASIELDPTAAVSNQVLTYNGSKWIPQTFSGVSGISGAGAAGDVAFWTSGSIIGGNSTFFWDTSSTPNRLIIGSNVGAVGGPQLTLVSDATGSGMSIEGYSVTPTVSSFKAGGSKTSPTSVLKDQVMLSLTARGYRSGAFNNTSTGRINFVATEDWTSGSIGTDILMYTTGSGGSTLVESLRVRPESIDIVGKNFKLDAAMEIDPSGATSGSVLGFNGSKWVAMSLSSGSSSSGSGSSSGISGSGSSTQAAYFTSGSVIAGSANFVWNETNNQFKIGSTSGSSSMSINSSSVEKNITLKILQPSWTGGTTNRALQVTGGTLLAQTEEVLSVWFQQGAIAFSTAPFIQRSFYIDAPVYSGTTAGKVITISPTVFIAGAPTTSGSNITITNSYALQVFAGGVIFGGGLVLGQTTGSAATGQLRQSGSTQIWNSNTIQFDSSVEFDTTGATNGNSLVFNGTKWIAGTSSGSSVGTSGSGVANQIAYWTGPSLLSGSSLMDFDSTVPRVRFGLTGSLVSVGINSTSGSSTTLQVTQPTWVGGSNPSVLVLTPGTLTSQIGSPATLASQAMTVTWIKANLPSSFSPNVFSAPVLNANASGGTMATAATVKIVGAPTSGSNLTVTTSASLWVQAGTSLFTDGILIGSLTSGSVGQLWQSSSQQNWNGNAIQFDAAMRFDSSGATTNQALVFSGSKWIPGTPAGMLTNFSASSSPRIALWNNTTTLTGDAAFTWDGFTFNVTPGGAVINTPVKTVLIKPAANTIVHNLNEAIDVDIDLTRLLAGLTFTSGSLSAQRAVVIRPPIWGLDVGSPGTIDDGATVAITGAPTTTGSSLVVTRLHALWVQSGEVLLAGGLDLGTASGATTGQLRQSAATQIWNSKTIQFDASMELDSTGATNGQALVYNGSKWVASSTGGVSGISGAGSANQVAYFTSGSVITSGSNFTFSGNQVGLLTSGSTGGILFSLDTLLYRKSARFLELAGSFGIDDGLNIGLVSGAAIGQLKQSATSQIWGSSTLTLDASMELDPSGAISNQVLGYNGSKWVAQTVTSGSSGSLDFYNVVDYGADKTGVSDSTSAISSAIAAASSGGVLFFPRGIFKTSGNHTVSQSMYILGEGMSDNYGTNALSQINCTSGSNSVFIITARNGSASNLAFKNTSGSSPAPTAGASITVAGSDEGQKFNFESISVYGFYYGFDVQVGQQWTMRNCQSMGNVKYGLKIRNTVNGDGGDWSVSDSYFNSDTYDSDAGVKIESSGGGKITNCKFNDGFNSPGHKFTYPIYLEPTSPTSILLIANNSIENAGTHGIFVNVGGSAYNQLIIRGNQINTGSGSGNSINITSGSLNKINHVVIADNIFLSTSGSSAVALNKVNDVFLDNNVFIGFTNVFTQNGCTNIYNESFDGDYSEATYNTSAITLGTAATGSYADTDATNAKIAFTPSSDGRYRVTFIFSHDRKAAVCDVFFRLTDGTTQSLSQESYSTLATAEEVTVVTLSKVFSWTSQVSHTVKLQHRNGTQTTTTVNQVAADSTLNIGLYMTVERIGS